MVSDKRLYFIIGGTVVVVVAVVLAGLTIMSRPGDREGDAQVADGREYHNGSASREKHPITDTPRPLAPPSSDETEPPSPLPAPELTDEQRAEALEKKLFEVLEELWPVYPLVLDGTATAEEQQKVKDIHKQIGKLLSRLRGLKSRRAVEALRRFAYRNKGKEVPFNTGSHCFDGCIGAGFSPYFIIDWDAPGARDLLFEFLHTFEWDSLYYDDLVRSLGLVKDEKERAKEELLSILATYPSGKPGGSLAGTHWRHVDALNSLKQLDPDTQLAAFGVYVKDEKRRVDQRNFVMDNLARGGDERYFEILHDVASSESISPAVRSLAFRNLASMVWKLEREGSENTRGLRKKVVDTAREIYERKSWPETRGAAYSALRVLGEEKPGEYSGPPGNLNGSIESLVYNTNLIDVGTSIIKSRNATARSLREYTGRNFGYLEAKSDEERVAAAAKWKEWYEKNKDRIRWNQEKYRYEVTEPTEPPDTPDSSGNSSESE